jgi:hypothetical protein
VDSQVIPHRLDERCRQPNAAVGIPFDVEYLWLVAIDDDRLKFSRRRIERYIA